MSCFSVHLTQVPVFVLMVSSLYWLCAPALAQARVDAAARAAVDRIDAARGAAALPATLRVRGNYEVFFGGAPSDAPVAKGAFEDLFRGDDHARHASDMGPFGKLQRGFTPELAWEVDPSLGAKRYDGPAGAAVRRYFGALRGTSPRQLYAAIAAAGNEDVDGAACAVLVMQPQDGVPDRWFVDADGYLRRLEIVLPSPDSAGAVFDMADTVAATIAFADWRKVGDIAYPHRRVLKMGPATVVLKVSEVMPGAELADDAFAPPEAVRKLKPKVASQPIGSDAPTCLVVDREVQPVVSIRLKCKPDELGRTMAIVLPEVMAHITATGGKIAGAPFSRYHSFAADEVDMEAGIPVAKPIEEKGRIKNSELPGGRALTAWHLGPYEGLAAAHRALAAHAAKEKMTALGGPWEVYWTDPGMVTDQAKWRTQLFLPIE